MQLIIDIGNTSIKYYVFEKGNILDSFSEKLKDWEVSLNKIKRAYPNLSKVMLSDVNGSFEEPLKKALKMFQVFRCSFNLKLPFTTLYSPQKQLGEDRIALLAASANLYPTQNVLIIDLGSCITYDLLDKDRVHQGGSISPGFSMRYKSMYDYSGKLPLLAPEETQDNYGTSTEAALHTGVYNGIINELKGVIQTYQLKYGHLTVILTGGDAKMLPKPLKNSIFAHSNFLAKGLNYILAMNTIS
ncbi:MAG: type III pantothenate kinase [Flavobacteriaceae bacterium]|jgi:type III pantothenate kinase|tara:strand:- start:4762 stop:5493 length:732 start_codon:yes stop_codon:yes gene_type:complete